MRNITVDCAGITTREALHDRLAEALAFPQWYGKNLDALHDCLTDIHEDTRLTLLHWQAPELHLGRYGDAARRAISAAAAENSHLMTVFL